MGACERQIDRMYGVMRASYVLKDIRVEQHRYVGT